MVFLMVRRNIGKFGKEFLISIAVSSIYLQIEYISLSRTLINIIDTKIYLIIVYSTLPSVSAPGWRRKATELRSKKAWEGEKSHSTAPPLPVPLEGEEKPLIHLVTTSTCAPEWRRKAAQLPSLPYLCP
jgi:hypothetical protein